MQTNFIFYKGVLDQGAKELMWNLEPWFYFSQKIQNVCCVMITKLTYASSH